MSSFLPPTTEEIESWGWEIGAEAGHRLADESDTFIGVTVPTLDAPAALETYGRAYLRAFVRGYRATLQRLLTDRVDDAANLRRKTAPTMPKMSQKGEPDDHARDDV